MKRGDMLMGASMFHTIRYHIETNLFLMLFKSVFFFLDEYGLVPVYGGHVGISKSLFWLRQINDQNKSNGAIVLEVCLINFIGMRTSGLVEDTFRIHFFFLVSTHTYAYWWPILDWSGCHAIQPRFSQPISGRVLLELYSCAYTIKYALSFAMKNV